jgi:hypothetical protein
MNRFCAFSVFLCLAPATYAQLSPSQKITDFQDLAGLYDKNYGPYEWKKQVFNFDVLNIQPWLAQINQSTDDLSFYDICVRYVASLQDSHDEFTLPSIYEAYLPFTVDIYDGNVLVDSIDRTVLSNRSFPFQVGDQLVSVDGVTVADWITALQPYTVNGSANPVSRNRLAAAMILDRYQGWYTYANKVGGAAAPTASVVIQSQSTGKTSTYTMAWETFGTPLTQEGPVPTLQSSVEVLAAKARPSHESNGPSSRRRGSSGENPWGVWDGPAAPAVPVATPDYMAPLQTLRNFSYLKPLGAAASGSIDPFDPVAPVFGTPPGFKLRLGSKQTDQFVSGTFPVGKLNVGFIRIYTMEPSNETLALDQFQSETTFFQQNTDGLVIDIMRNGGGDLCYITTLAQYLIPNTFRTLPLELRATENWIEDFSDSLSLAQLEGSPQWVVNLYSAYLGEVQTALGQNRGLTGPLPLCGPTIDIGPATDSNGNSIAYTKPIVLVTDNFTLSAAESFAATLQDAGRATVYGTRTDGGGGNVVSFDAGSYAEGATRVTESLEIRANPITTPGYPSAPLIENIGVYPDVMADYQTMDNLLNNGKTFVAGFSTAISNLVTQGHP